MPSLNQAKFVGAAIDSVLGQDYPNIELVVADGGSGDGTVELLKARQVKDSRLRWFSQKDNGPAQALNGAMSQARGTILGWLNSDDLYAPGAVRRAFDALQANPGWLMVYGQGQHIDGSGKLLNLYPTLPPSTPVRQFAEGCFICQPTVFFRRSMWVLLGKFDEKLKTAFDFDYWLRAFLAFPERIGFVDVVQACSRLHDDCITLRMRRTVIMEGMQVLARHLGSAPKEWLLTYVDELLAADAQTKGPMDLRKHVETMVDEVAELIAERDLNEVRLRLSQDERLGVSPRPC
ncbi:MAG: glycosyltransferase family 2 protein [Sterolibacterium sp.]